MNSRFEHPQTRVRKAVEREHLAPGMPGQQELGLRSRIIHIYGGRPESPDAGTRGAPKS